MTVATRTTQECLDGLIADITNYDAGMYEPKTPVAKEETVLFNIIDDELMRKSYIAMMFAQREHKQAKINLGFDGLSEAEATPILNAFDAKADALREIFWWLLRERYNLWEQFDIGIRTGWMLVKKKSDEPPKALKLSLE